MRGICHLVNIKESKIPFGQNLNKITIVDVASGLIEILHEETIRVLVYVNDGELINLSDTTDNLIKNQLD